MHKPSSNDLVVTTRHAWSLQRGQDPVELKLQVWVLRIELGISKKKKKLELLTAEPSLQAPSKIIFKLLNLK
jgi:hypothetical protein